MEYIYIFAGIVLFLGIGLYFYINRIPNITLQNVIQEEIFCCQLVGIGRLQTSPNIGQLQQGYRYALDSDINDALIAGLRVYGVSSGDLAAYSGQGAINAAILPNTYVTQQGDFSTEKQINFNNTNDQNQHTFWVFVKGYKPSIEYQYNSNMIFVPNTDIQHFVKILPWNTLSWNAPLTSSAQDSYGNEVFLATVSPMPLDLNFVNNALNSGFSLATLDQIIWASSKGLNYSHCSGISYSAIVNGNAALGQMFAPTQCTSQCINCSQYLAIWGPKPATATTAFSTFAATTILKFNDEKYSMYN